MDEEERYGIYMERLKWSLYIWVAFCHQLP